jgi:hypothetical protein
MSLELALLRSLGIKKRGHDLVASFCGWPEILRFTGDASHEIAGLGSCLFATGARISEAKLFRKELFNLQKINGEDFLLGEGLPTLKKGSKATPIMRRRTIPMLASEPTTVTFIKFLDRSDSVLFPHSRNWYWTLMNRYRSDWWPHRFRTERASQLVTEYGYEIAHLVKFFNWSGPTEALGYVRLSPENLAEAMRRT